MSKKLAIIILNRFLRKSRPLTKLLFRVKVLNNKRIQWDFTTLAFKRPLNVAIKDEMKVLEIGTGPHAILSIFLARRCKCDITACDINAEYVEDAIKSAELNKVNIDIVQSDLFTNISGKFDIIMWNTVYIPYEIGMAVGMDRLCEYQTDWCGGKTGLESIEKFLKSAPDYMKPSGNILLGFNSVYLKEDLVIQRCKDLGFSIDSISKNIFNPSRVISISIIGLLK